MTSTESSSHLSAYPRPEDHPGCRLTIWVDLDGDGTSDANFTYYQVPASGATAGCYAAWRRHLSGLDDPYALGTTPARDSGYGRNAITRWRVTNNQGVVATSTDV